jgi:choice-of-anchor A domain-containing protein
MTARRRFIAPALAGAALCLPLLALPARADVLTAQQILSQFNLVDLGNLSSSSEVEGRTFVGGDLSGNSSTYGTRTLSASSYATLTVDGAVSASVNVNTGGIAVGNGISGGANLNGNTASQVGGTITGQANFNGGSVTLANAPTGNVNFNGASHTVVPGTAPGVAASTFSAPITTLSSQPIRRPSRRHR